MLLLLSSLLIAGFYIACLGVSLKERDVYIIEEEDYPSWVEVYITFPFVYFKEWIIAPLVLGIWLAMSDNYRNIQTQLQIEDNELIAEALKEAEKENGD